MDSQEPLEEPKELSGLEATERSEEPSTKRELRKILREDSNWSIRSITVTALTGVSVAVISTQLNGLVSSMVLIAVMAFITASISEIYRIFLALTGFGAKRAAVQAAKVIPLVPKLSASDQDGSPRAVTVEREIEAPKDPVTEALEVVKESYQLNGQQRAENPGVLKRFFYRFKNYSKANPFLLLVVLFFGIGITTVAVAYAVTDGSPPQIIERTVQVINEEELSEEDRASIVADAKEGALESLAPQQSATALAVDSSTVSGELTALSERLSAMEKQMKELAPEPQPDSSTVPATDQDLLDRISSLEAEREALTKSIEELQAKLAALEASSPSSAPSATSMPSAGGR